MDLMSIVGAIVWGYVLLGVIFTLLIKLKLIKNEVEYYSSKGVMNTLRYISFWPCLIKFYIYTYPDWGWIIIGNKDLFGFYKVVKIDMRSLRVIRDKLDECNKRIEILKANLKEK